jgi:hypothetical protein
MSRRARLLNLRVQANFVIDDGDTLVPWNGPVVEIAAAEWPEFREKAFSDDDLSVVLEAYEATRAGADRG